MAVALDPVEQLREQIELTAARDDISDGERAAMFRLLRDRLTGLLGLLARYAHDERRAQESARLSNWLTEEEARSRANFREEMLDRGIATEQELDELGYFSHDELNKLAEEGLLEESLMGFVRRAMYGSLFERVHPRGRGGQWIDKPGGGSLLKTNLKSKKSTAGADASHAPPHAARGVRTGLPPEGEPRAKFRGYRAIAGDMDDADLVAQIKQHGPDSERGKAAKEELEQRGKDEFGEKVQELEARTKEKVAAARSANFTGAEAHFNDAGKVSQHTLARYVDQAATQPTTIDRYSQLNADGSRVWDESRRELHERIINRFLRQRVFDPEAKGGKGDWVLSDDAPELPASEEPSVLFSGGGYAAGKSAPCSSCCALSGDEPDSGYEGPTLTLDPDQIKAMLPEYQEALGSDPEANMRVYEEAWAIAQEIQARAQEKKLNMIVDGISDTSPEEMVGRVQELPGRGLQGARRLRGHPDRGGA